ncbi:MAG: T9SS type A sorting domain-containing protein, partial [Candidatus Zixiibacteriota bacterium]
PITPSSASLAILPAGIYDFQTKKVKFIADTSGHYVIKIIAGTPCSVDTCVIEADVSLYQVPQITCPGTIDTLVCLPDISEICFPVSIIGAEVTVKILPAGTYSGGMVCVPVTSAGSRTVTIIASSQCGADTCFTNLNVSANQAPILTVPENLTIPWCDDETEPICIDGIFATDINGDNFTITQVCGLGTYTPVRDDSGVICFNPPNIDSTYEFCLEVTDGCSTDFQSMFVTVYTSPLCSVCVDISINVDSCYVVGSNVPVRIVAETRSQIGGFDLLMAYDASVLSFTYAVQGDAIDEWEYFTYRLIDNDGCGTSCPSGLIRLVGIADENNGPYHPSADQLTPSGVISIVGLRIANNQNLGGQYLPISFYWIDCGDNSMANPLGDLLYIDSKIFGNSGSLLWDEYDDTHYPESARPDGVGAPDECLVGDKTTPIRCVYFHNGGICVTHPDSIDARGDVNLNGVAYEIADAVVFTNYFIYGLSAFTVNVAGQIAATDVNADGFTLTVADLVYLVRVIIGDASAIPKVSPNMLQVDLTVTDKNNAISVKAENDCPVGAALLIFEYDGVTPEPPILGNLANNMSLAYRISDNEIRVLIYSLERGRAIPEGDGEILTLNYGGHGHVSLVETSMASFHGDIIKTNQFEDMLPSDFSVSQNYPNPFNPATAIDLSLPIACHWELCIYNINGQFVTQFSGDAQPGIVTIVWDGRNDGGQMAASGVYFYKVRAGNFTDKKKMTLLK